MGQQLIGTIIKDRYRFDALVGEGTFARVFRVHDLRRNVDLAAKVLRDDIAHEPTFIERFRREAEVLRQLQHPHIVRYYETVEDRQAVFILLDFVEGITLQTHLYQLGRPLTVKEALQFVRPLCAALSYAHGENIIHRDIKPGNILISQTGQVYITDFGIARLIDDAGTLTQGMMVGTPLYMAPEQILGQPVTPATDIYGVGVLLYQMLTGKVPFTGNRYDAQGTTLADKVAYEHLNLPPQNPRDHNPDLSHAAQSVILRCLRKEPTSRYPSALAVYDALAETVGATPAELEAIYGEPKPQPPGVKLPEWSQVANPPVTQPPPVPTTPSQRPVPDNPYTNQTISRQEVVYPADPPPPLMSNYQYRMEDLQPMAPVPPASKHESSSFSRWVMVLVGIGVTALLLVCLGAVYVIFDLFTVNNDEPAPTRRAVPTEAAVVATIPGQPTVPPTPINLDDVITTPTTAPQTSGGTGAIVYASDRDGNLNLYHLDLASGEEMQLTDDSLNETGADFSPDGSQIVYYAYTGSGAADLWVMNADGSNQRQLTDTDANERVASWSPDGTQLAYHSDADGDYEIYILDVATGTGRPITSNENIDDLAPAWSPDGALIAFHSDENNNFNEIFVMQPDGSERRQVTDGQWNAAFAGWSPDSRRLVFHAITSGDQYDLYTIDADGSNYQTLFEDSNQQRHGDWSPDGNRLVYVAGSQSAPEVWMIDLLTGNITKIADQGHFPEWQP